MNQIDKNTVSAYGQLKNKDSVEFETPTGSGLRVMFVGNSITLHGENAAIGWPNHWGMAASARENDYAHRLMKRIRALDEQAAFCICQVSHWETRYEEGSAAYEPFTAAPAFEPDVIVMRLIENCRQDGFDSPLFQQKYEELIRYLGGGRAKVILTTSFWHHVGDDAIREVASRTGYPLVELGDLGEQDEMKAIGLFAHDGVANHPGDRGMEKIADRIFEAMQTAGFLTK